MAASGPTPWWQLPEYSGSYDNLKSSAPAGYEYDPIQMGYVRKATDPASQASASLSALRTQIPGLDASFFSSGSSGASSTPPPQRSQNDYAQIAMPDLPNFSTQPGSGGQSYAPNQVQYQAPNTSIGQANGGTPGSIQYNDVPAPNLEASQAAAFARAKDKAGQMAAASLRSLRGVLGGRGLLGSGAESDATRSIISSGQGQLGEVSREQAIQEAAMREREATTSYQGAIAQRSQTINAMQSDAMRELQRQIENANSANRNAETGYQGAITQRGQDISAHQQAAQLEYERQLATQRSQYEAAMARYNAQVTERNSRQQYNQQQDASDYQRWLDSQKFAQAQQQQQQASMAALMRAVGSSGVYA